MSLLDKLFRRGEPVTNVELDTLQEAPVLGKALWADNYIGMAGLVESDLLQTGWNIISDKVVRVRKDHRCEWCPEVIGIGERALYQVGTSEGEFYYGYMHLNCRAALNGAPRELVEEGWEISGFARGSTMEAGLNVH